VCWGFAFRLIGAGAACLVHGLVPSLFERTGSRTIKALHDEMVVNRDHASAKWRLKRVA
jgi:hypothetical protein